MILSFPFSPESLREGAREFLWHRTLFITLLLPFLGAIFVILGLLYIFGGDYPNYVSGGIMISVGVFYLLRFKHRLNSVVRNAFKANPNPRTITMVVEDGSLFITDGESEGRSPLSVFVDFKICKNGVLIYPQKGIFYWIPSTAEIEGGTWQDFTDLISSKITRRI